MKKHVFLSALLALAAALPARAQQLFLDFTSPDTLVMDFFNGHCVDVSNVTFFGQPGQVAFFEAGGIGLGVNAGILLATGDASVAIGPNDQDNASAGYGISTPDKDLSMLAQGGAPFDKARLHFYIVPRTDSIGFQYVFASEEYCEYVGTQFNDAFGFFIKGPGIQGPFGGAANLATLPGGSNAYVAINNVNHFTNSAHYVHNTPADGNNCGLVPPPASPLTNFLQFDGLTTVLTASTAVVRDSTYEVWIVTSDLGDGIFDSGVFIGIESLCGDSLLDPVNEFAVVPKGNNTLRFVNHTRYATAWHWDFGDGSTSNQRFPEHTFADLGQKQYTVRLISTNYCCADTIYYVVGSASSLTELAAADFKVYPARIQDELTVEPSDLALSGTLTLSDMAGRRLSQQLFSGKTTLSVSHLPPGAYLLHIQTDDGRRATRKVLK
jgi:hypothetical protein